jgi:hypothetical protein
MWNIPIEPTTVVIILIGLVILSMAIGWITKSVQCLIRVVMVVVGILIIGAIIIMLLG